jgi:hypothetical protein
MAIPTMQRKSGAAHNGPSFGLRFVRNRDKRARPDQT